MLQELLTYRARKRTACRFSLQSLDCEGEDLSELRADGLIFNDINLISANLKHIHWRNCRLHNVRLAAASLCHSVLRMCTLEQVQAQQADFSGAALENSTACGCTFDGADFTGASLVDSDFSRSSLRNATLQSASAGGASFRGADLRGACLRQADFSDADLRGADLTGADLEGTHLQGADLRGALLDAAAEPAGPAPSDDFSPAFQGLAIGLGPLVERLLHEGSTTGILDGETSERLVNQLEEYLGRSDKRTVPPEMNRVLDAMLRRTADTGIAPLLEALKQETDTPPQAVADLLENLRSDLKLEQDSTMEDLLVQLITGLHQTPPSRE